MGFLCPSKPNEIFKSFFHVSNSNSPSVFFLASCRLSGEVFFYGKLIRDGEITTLMRPHVNWIEWCTTSRPNTAFRTSYAGSCERNVCYLPGTKVVWISCCEGGF